MLLHSIWKTKMFNSDKITGKNVLAAALGIIASSYLFYKLWFLRAPARTIPHNDNLFISPANGKVIAVRKFNEASFIEAKDSPLTERGAFKILTSDVAAQGTIITIMLQVTDVHYQRACTSGVVQATKYTAVNKLNAIQMPQEQISRYENEHNEILISTDKGLKYKIVQIAGFVARQIECYVAPSQLIAQGQVLGIINFGSQVTVILPPAVQVTAKEGDYLIDGETVIGKVQ